MWVARQNVYGLHVCPSGEDHTLHQGCDCEPKIMDDVMTMEYPVIIHNAFDGRELLDEVQKILDSSKPFDM